MSADGSKNLLPATAADENPGLDTSLVSNLEDGRNEGASDAGGGSNLVAKRDDAQTKIFNIFRICYGGVALFVFVLCFLLGLVLIGLIASDKFVRLDRWEFGIAMTFFGTVIAFASGIARGLFNVSNR